MVLAPKISISFGLFLISLIVSPLAFLQNVVGQGETLTDSDASTYYANPSNYLDNKVEFTGKILTLLTPTSGLYGLQMYQGGDTTRNTIVIYDGVLQVSQDDCVKVTGVSQPVTEYLNVFGATLAAAAIKADSIIEIDCSESIEPVEKIVNVDETQVKNNIKVTLHKVEFSDINTRAHLTIENLHQSLDIAFYDFDSRAIQGKTQFITINSFDVEYPKIESIIPAGIVENGVVLFEPLNPTESEAQFRLDVKDTSYDNIRFIFDVILSPLEVYDKALASDPNNVSTLINKGFALSDLGNYSEAIEIADKALAIDPDNSWALILKGTTLNVLGNYSEAIEFIDKALAIDPNDVFALTSKGTVLHDSGNHSEAIEFIDKALAIDPDNSLALVLKGASLSNLGNHSEAIKYYDKALAIDPNNVFALTSKGTVLNDSGNHSEAIEFIDKALAIDPDNSWALVLKGASLSDLGNYTEAIELYDKALAIDPNDMLALNNKGLALLNLGNYTGASDNYDKALAIDPNDLMALIGKANVLAGFNDRTGSMDILDNALEIYPDNPLILELKSIYGFT